MPFYAEINLIILFISFILCLLPEFLCGVYAVIRWIFGANKPRLPRVPLYPCTSFPNVWDKFGCFFMLGLFVLSCTSECLHPNETHEPADAAAVVFNTLVLIAIYVPFIVRLGFLPQMGFRRTGQRSLSHFLFAVGAILTLLILSGIYEASGLISWFVRATGSPEYQDVVVSVAKGDAFTKLITIAVAVIVAPFGEECFFRGFLYNTLKDRWGTIAAAVVSSLMFASIHLALPQFIMLFTMGIFQCILYERSHSVRVPIFSHALFNSISVIATLFFFPES